VSDKSKGKKGRKAEEQHVAKQLVAAAEGAAELYGWTGVSGSGSRMGEAVRWQGCQSVSRVKRVDKSCSSMADTGGDRLRG
jgi:hypothetical protein